MGIQARKGPVLTSFVKDDLSSLARPPYPSLASNWMADPSSAKIEAPAGSKNRTISLLVSAAAI